MMVRSACAGDIPALTALWQEAFGDTPAQIRLFFDHGFSPDRSLVLEDGELAAACYWFDCWLENKKLAYLYAVAVKYNRRGQGLGRRLMEEVHQHLYRQGYDAVVLVPGEESLFAWYASIGYTPCSPMVQETVTAAGNTRLQSLAPQEYAAARRVFLPAGGVTQEGENLAYMAAMFRFYRGDGFILAAAREGTEAFIPEILGQAELPAITAALGAATGTFRRSGPGKCYAMVRPLRDFQPKELTWFGWAFD